MRRKMDLIYIWFKQRSWENRILIMAGLISLVPASAMWLHSSANSTADISSKEGVPQVDTLIPKGYVLVPIEAENYEAVDSILGRFGIVDLFQGDTSGASRARLVARNVRLLRAPNNPSHFAVLIPEGEASEVLRGGSGFTVVVKRPEASGTEFVKPTSKVRRKVIYEGG